MSNAHFIDLRSDTLSTPTEAMRQAMASADVGDDVYDADPTATRLQATAADMLGKQAALFFPSGTMANQVAIHLHARPGEELIAECEGHTNDWELGGAAALSGVQVRAIPGDDGVLRPEHVAPWLQPRPYHQSRIALLVIENTHNMAGGRICPQETCIEVVEMARAAGLRAHLDGARLFNAAVATGRPAAELAAPFDSVMISISKGLSAPIGSLLAGDAAFIAEARRVRKLFGGGMRQVGVIAAAGEVALSDGIARLADDHAHATRLAEGLLAPTKLRLATGRVDTNIVVVDVAATGMSAAEFVAAAEQRAVRCSTTMSGNVRFVTYRDIESADIETALVRLEPLIA